jgi:magnesium transporter
MPLQTMLNWKGFADRVREMLFRNQDALLRELLAKMGDEDVIHVVDSLSVHEKRRMFKALSAERLSRVLLKLSEYSQETVLPALSHVEVASMIDAAESDDAVDLIQLLQDGQRDRVIADLKKNDPHGLMPLLVFGEETAGGRMKHEAFRIRAESTVDEARRQIARESATKPKSHQIYVMDDKDVLVGTLPLMRLLTAAPEARLAELMNVQFVSVPPTMDQEEMAQVFDEHNAIELPVVGPKGRVLGIVTADDIFEVMEKEYAEDISRLTGVDEDDRISDPVLLTVRRRLPWLVVNLATAVLAAGVVSLFQDTIQRLVILAAYMPIIAGMGGNAATQTLGVVVRAIALGELRHLNTAHAIAKQVAAGTLNGFANGVIMGGIAYAWTGNLGLAAVILVAMTVNLLVAGLGGVAVPIVMKRMRIDPALASTVFVTTLTDVCGFFVFLGLASVFL